MAAMEHPSGAEIVIIDRALDGEIECYPVPRSSCRRQRRLAGELDVLGARRHWRDVRKWWRTKDALAPPHIRIALKPGLPERTCLPRTPYGPGPCLS